MPPNRPERVSRRTERMAFLLIAGCSAMAVGSALEVLAHANQASAALSGPILYETLLVSADGRPVRTSTATIAVDLPLDGLPTIDGLFVISDVQVAHQLNDTVVAFLQRFASESKLLGGVGTGAWLLAQAGLLEGYRATVQWSLASVMAERFPQTIVSSHVFEADRQRLTCAGGHAVFDMLVHRIRETHGNDLVQHLLAMASLERARGMGEPQRAPLSARIGGGQPKLTEAVALMEANIAEPLPIEDIVQLVGISRRQLERLFKVYLDSLPSRYYTELRLKHAQQLLQQTSQSILQIGLGCGFSSGAHFSNAYRGCFGITPRDQRNPRVNNTPVGRTALTDPTQGEKHG